MQYSTRSQCWIMSVSPAVGRQLREDMHVHGTHRKSHYPKVKLILWSASLFSWFMPLSEPSRVFIITWNGFCYAHKQNVRQKRRGEEKCSSSTQRSLSGSSRRNSRLLGLVPSRTPPIVLCDSLFVCLTIWECDSTIIFLQYD